MPDPRMPEAQLLRVSEDLVLRPFQLTITRFEVVPPGFGDRHSHVHFEAWVRSVADGTPIRVVNVKEVPWFEQLNGEDRSRSLLDFLIQCIAHEAQECLRFNDGKPVVEPHPHPWSRENQ